VREPLAVRSSSLLEDSQYHPFAGVYQTYMIPNNHPDPFIRLSQLINAVKRVYASTFYQSAKDYIKATAYRLEEEKMAVIVQKMVGSAHGSRFYPHFSGVAKSYNFYPVPPQKAQDGIVSTALGLGKMVVDGGVTVRFCPKYPKHLMQFFSAQEALRTSQTEFYALDLTGQPSLGAETTDALVNKHPLNVAAQDGTLNYVVSTYSPENDVLYDGPSPTGIPVVSFAPVLKDRIFPLPEILELLLDMGSWGMGTPVEIEFAVHMSGRRSDAKEFGLLQMRPLVLGLDGEASDVEGIAPQKLICSSTQVLGHGATRDIYDIVVADVDRFDRSKSRDVAREVTVMNHKLVSENRPYLLIGVGRWGSLDPWLGIPVRWDQISGARAIVEADFKDLTVDPSQGSHFFQNIISFMIGYFTVSSANRGFVDWDWLRKQPAVEELSFVRHLRVAKPVVVKLNSRLNKGVILKPE